MKIDELLTALRLIKTKADAEVLMEEEVKNVTYVLEIERVIVDDCGDVRILAGGIDYERMRHRDIDRMMGVDE